MGFLAERVAKRRETPGEAEENKSAVAEGTRARGGGWVLLNLYIASKNG